MLEACHAREVIEQALARYGTSEIVNTDQGNQFTAEEFTQAVLERGCRLSMDGKGAWLDNVFVERLWRTIKYERVYLLAYDGVSAVRADLAQFIDWYNTVRLHSSLDETPEQAYWAKLPAMKMAAKNEKSWSAPSCPPRRPVRRKRRLRRVQLCTTSTCPLSLYLLG